MQKNIVETVLVEGSISANVSYNESIGKNNINFLAGVNIKESKTSGSNEHYYGFPSGDLSSPNYAKEIADKQYNEATNQLVGFLASLNYTYNNIYLTDLSDRYDGSSAFGGGKRFAPFWSVGAGINIHNYEFMKGNKIISQLRIRGSYGQTVKANFPAYTARTSYGIQTVQWQYLPQPMLKIITTQRMI